MTEFGGHLDVDFHACEFFKPVLCNLARMECRSASHHHDPINAPEVELKGQGDLLVIRTNIVI